jgi:hypothetical protein
VKRRAVATAMLAVSGYVYFWMMPPSGMTFEAVVVLISALAGAVLGAWVASMIDAPTGRAAELREILFRMLPGTVDGRLEPAIRAFP